MKKTNQEFFDKLLELKEEYSELDNNEMMASLMQVILMHVDRNFGVTNAETMIGIVCRCACSIIDMNRELKKELGVEEEK